MDLGFEDGRNRRMSTVLGGFWLFKTLLLNPYIYYRFARRLCIVWNTQTEDNRYIS